MICGAISETDTGLVVFCELQAPHPGRFHDVLLNALEDDLNPDNPADRYGEHYAWPNTDPPQRERFVHNVIAHPLLVLWPRLGRWLHDRTEP